MLLVDAQRLRSKPLLCSQPTDTTRLLAQLTPMLLRAHQADAASPQLLALHEAQRAWTRRAATDASAPLERALLAAGLGPEQMKRVAGRFGSEAGLRAAYRACTSHAARERLLCPLLEDAAVGRCAAGGDAPCCRLGKGVLVSLVGGGGSTELGAAAASGCIDLTADVGAAGARAAESDESEDEAEMASFVERVRQRKAREAAAQAAPPPGGAPAERRCELVLGSGLERKKDFLQLIEREWPRRWGREAAAASQPAGAWLQLWASQGELVSSLHTLHWSSAESLVLSMRHALSDLPAAQLAELKAAAPRQHERDVHPALLDAACATARHLVDGLPAPHDPLRDARGRRQTHLLVLGGIEKVRNGHAGLGKGSGGHIERLLEQVAWPLAQAALLAVQTFDSARGESWVVLPAKNDDHVNVVVSCLVRACHRRALLGLRES